MPLNTLILSPIKTTKRIHLLNNRLFFIKIQDEVYVIRNSTRTQLNHKYDDIEYNYEFRYVPCVAISNDVETHFSTKFTPVSYIGIYISSTRRIVIVWFSYLKTDFCPRDKQITSFNKVMNYPQQLQVCELIRNNAVQKFDEEQQMAYAVLEDQWAGYPNRKSMQAKVGYHNFNSIECGSDIWTSKYAGKG